MRHVVLNTGCSMPILGLGTFRITGSEQMRKTLEAALSSGYRSIDTASVYRNEKDIGDSLQELLPKFGLSRKDLFITSKLAPRDQGSEKCRQACLKSISDLQCGYLDLYLIHWPGAQGFQHSDDGNRTLRRQSWEEMQKMHQEGLIKSIGVSNYTPRHMEELLQNSDICPAVLQIEHHPHLIQHELVKMCRSKGILFQAYSSLGTTSDTNKLLSDPAVKAVAAQKKKTVAQVLLRWAVQQGIGVIPKSTNPSHIRENMDIFDMELMQEEMQTLNSLDTQKHYCWDPNTIT
ncbi:uncharacterized protein LOC106170151 isoform X1 [Lingula anatina]|uniref:Uncharacterized protein LOC106170151 isoform X1 n=1 Tax=Lingula anatina TaxID=7574 RepID=A0A1S3J697_LINAN|nr:uncharacterized protein LOC106170151 isoform X1 [Lingula anatina]|eukprot:XP_013405364.1 uncharacterized protein LOC106170151 isoform X1 [Lingula anatina]